MNVIDGKALSVKIRAKLKEKRTADSNKVLEKNKAVFEKFN